MCGIKQNVYLAKIKDVQCELNGSHFSKSGNHFTIIILCPKYYVLGTDIGLFVTEAVKKL